jgi:6-pyruvoyl-tetrahydropterin synthase
MESIHGPTYSVDVELRQDKQAQGETCQAPCGSRRGGHSYEVLVDLIGEVSSFVVKLTARSVNSAPMR